MVQITAGARDLSFVRSVQTSSGAQTVSCSVVTEISYCRGKADGAAAERSLHTFCWGLDHVELLTKVPSYAFVACKWTALSSPEYFITGTLSMLKCWVQSTINHSHIIVRQIWPCTFTPSWTLVQFLTKYILRQFNTSLFKYNVHANGWSLGWHSNLESLEHKAVLISTWPWPVIWCLKLQQESVLCLIRFLMTSY